MRSTIISDYGSNIYVESLAHDSVERHVRGTGLGRFYAFSSRTPPSGTKFVPTFMARLATE
jgi:hypothetical protein